MDSKAPSRGDGRQGGSGVLHPVEVGEGRPRAAGPRPLAPHCRNPDAADDPHIRTVRVVDSKVRRRCYNCDVPAARKIRTRTCAMCGNAEEVSREHVPPKNLFLKPRPTNTITVDLCVSCNHGYHLDDEYFRVYIAAGATPGTKLMELWKQKVVGSSFVRGGGLKGRLNDDYELVQEHARHEPLQLFGGGTVPPELLPLVQAFNAARINAVVEKIVRCLHMHETGGRLLGNLAVSVAPFSDTEWKTTLQQRTGEVGHDNEFVYRYSSEGAPIWRLIFYERHSFLVHPQPAVAAETIRVISPTSLRLASTRRGSAQQLGRVAPLNSKAARRLDGRLIFR